MAGHWCVTEGNRILHQATSEKDAREWAGWNGGKVEWLDQAPKDGGKTQWLMVGGTLAALGVGAGLLYFLKNRNSTNPPYSNVGISANGVMASTPGIRSSAPMPTGCIQCAAQPIEEYVQPVKTCAENLDPPYTQQALTCPVTLPEETQCPAGWSCFTTVECAACDKAAEASICDWGC